jgi:2-desacetyl-2-hydroxyethyl bacteriochlorophyllide A dehydrogenase
VRAAVLSDDRRRLEVLDLPDPHPDAGEVVVRVSECGVCGSDFHVVRGGGVPGTVLGHEIAGVVDQVGADVNDVAVGDVVALRPFVGCERCKFCADGRQDHCKQFAFIGAQRPGGFAERVVAPASEVFALPAEMRAEDQALVEPFAVARHGLRRGGLAAGETVVVLGAGPMGLALVHWARALGAGEVVVSDPIVERQRLALTLGADVAVDPREVRDRVGDGAPLVVECTGQPGLVDQALRLAAVDGRVAVVGICLAPDTIRPWSALHKELDIRFSLYYGRADFTETLDAFSSGALSPDALVTERVTLDALPGRFEQLLLEPNAGKLVVTP